MGPVTTPPESFVTSTVTGSLACALLLIVSHVAGAMVTRAGFVPA
jgi:hypothetical protein